MSLTENCGCGSVIKLWQEPQRRRVHFSSKKHCKWVETGVVIFAGRLVNLACIEDRKEAVKKRQNKKTLCECGCTVSVANMPAHKRSKKHLSLMETGVYKSGPRGEYNTKIPKEARTAHRREWERTRVKCDCGGEFTNQNKLQHFRTKKHLRLIEQKEKEPKWITIVVKKKRRNKKASGCVKNE